MKCSNCSSAAIYGLSAERVSSIYYCGKCLPPFLREAAAKGHLTLHYEPEVAPTTTKKRTAKSEPAPEPEASADPVVEEAIIVDEPVVEDEPVVVEESETTEA